MFQDAAQFEEDFNRLCAEGRNGIVSDIHMARGGRMTYLRFGRNVPAAEVVPPAFFDQLLDRALGGRTNPLPAHDFNGGLVLAGGIRVRLNAFVSAGTPCLALRLLSDDVKTPEALGVPASFTKIVEECRNGLILVTGPTNSGKSTTLASLINRRASLMEKVIITLEDPVEYPIGVGSPCRVFQREVGPDVSSFKEGLASSMRQSPDTILVGEVREEASAESVISLAASGHLVLTTFHTTSAVQTIDRFAQMFPGRETWAAARLADCLVATVCQRLVTRDDKQGRVALFEVCILNTAMRNHIRKGRAADIAGELIGSPGCMTFERSIREAEKSDLLKRGSIKPEDLS